MIQPGFSFSDLIAGYVTSAAAESDTFRLATTDDRIFEVRLTPTTVGELLRNLGEPYTDSTSQLREMLTPGRYLFAYGIFYPEGRHGRFEAKHLIFVDREPDLYRFEKPDWWIHQLHELAEFYLRAEFGGQRVDFRDYRTRIGVSGAKTGDYRQETDTISRLIYGFATAYLLTGEDRFLEAAEAGTAYLREHMRFVDVSEGIVYWYHAIDVHGPNQRKIFASEFGDDYDAIPMYEQIYAMAGPTQTYRITGDPRILHDIERTLRLFDRHFLDTKHGGYFSHVDPVTLDPHSPALGGNRARKNWNSVGDHAPAYLINLWLATGDERHARMLTYTADTIVKHFPDDEHSPFVQERFHEDWSPDTEWGWQQNRAVVGHNLKIAWNLMRINHLRPNQEYVKLARKIAGVMPTVGMDRQRGGWYDVMERVRGEGEEFHRFVWHDRKAWWQQEQAILAYLILAGSLKEADDLRMARESAAFYNAMFLDHDDGGVYFNVLASGTPFLTGNERLKGSHSMSGYHSFELGYLAAVYTNLLISHERLDLHFKPRPGALPDKLLRVQPDLLPAGSVRLAEVWIDGEPYADFDPEAMTVKLPPANRSLRVRVRLVPVEVTKHCTIVVDASAEVVRITLTGKLDARSVTTFEDELLRGLALQPRRLVLLLEDLESISPAGLRALAFRSHLLGVDIAIDAIKAQPAVRQALERSDLEVEFKDADDTVETIEGKER